MKPKDIRKMSRKEKIDKLNELRAELIKLRTQAFLGTLSNIGRVKVTRKNIARILTILREEELKEKKK